MRSFEPVDEIGMGILRRAQHELVLAEDVDETRVALDDARHEIDDAVQHGLQRIGRGKAAADFV
jgi:hypothetical protein